MTKEQEQRSKLSQALYQVFENAQLIVENARMKSSKQMQQLQQEAQQLHTKQQELENRIKEGKAQPQDVLPVYQQTLEVERNEKQLQEQDQKYLDLRAKLKIERDLYYNIGLSLMSKDIPEFVLQQYFDLIRLNAHRYTLQDHQLMVHQDSTLNTQIRSKRQDIVTALDKKMAELEQQRRVIEGRIASVQQREELSTHQADIESYKKIQAKLITDTEEALRLANEQINIVKQQLQHKPAEKSQVEEKKVLFLRREIWLKNFFPHAVFRLSAFCGYML